MIYVCTECGSSNVFQDAWIGVNNPLEILGPYDTYWCEDCDGECSIETEKEHAAKNQGR